MNRAIPAGADDLRQTTGIVAVVVFGIAPIAALAARVSMHSAGKLARVSP